MVLTTRFSILTFPALQKESVLPGVSRNASIPGPVNFVRFLVAVKPIVTQYFFQHDNNTITGFHRDDKNVIKISLVDLCVR